MAASQQTDLHILWRSLSSSRRRQLVIAAFLMPVTAIAEMAMVAAIVPFLALLAGGPDVGGHLPLLPGLLNMLGSWVPGNPILAAAVLFALAVLATMLCRLALTWVSQHFAFGSGHELAVEIQRRLLHQRYLFHVHRHSSELLTSLDKIDFLIFSTALQGIQALSAMLICLFVIAALLWIDPLTACLAAMFVGGLYGLALVASHRRLELHADVIRVAFEARFKAAQDSLGAIRDIILDRAQDLRVEQFRQIDARFMRARADAQILVAAPRFLVEGLGLVLIALVAVGIAGRPGGFVEALPVLGALALGAQRLLPLTSQIYSGWANLTASRPIIHELAELLDLPIDEAAEADIAPLPLTETIELEAVSFHYSDRTLPALHDISLTITKGARVAITGKTGSGKSTLADLLMGLIEPTQGKMTVDGQELWGSRLFSWRRSIAHVPQSIFLSDDSIAANIAMSIGGADIDMKRVRRAAQSAELAAFIDSLPNGYETRGGERGARLSGGQRQRLALARAIYKDAPLLVLDEATSALDHDTEDAVLKALHALQAKGRTIIIIAHRQTTIEGCDLIVRLDHGRLVDVTGSGSKSRFMPQGPSAVSAP
jgi:ABC-type multidrug transport system fused ATPase/permease subunit